MRRQIAQLAMVLAVGLVTLSLLLGRIPAGAARAGEMAAQGDSRIEQVTLTATGSNGSATGLVTTTTRLWGYLKAVYVDYGASVTTTTDITISTVSPAGTVMGKADSATDAWFYPSVQLTGITGTVVSGAYGQFPVDDYLTVQAAQSTSGTVAVVRIFYGQ